MMLRVCKRNGELEDVQFEKVTNRIKYLCEGKLRDGTVIGDPLSICYAHIAQDVISKIQDKITTSELDEFAARFCASLTKEHYQYGILGGRIAVSNHQKNTLSSFAETVRLLYENKKPDGQSFPLLDRKLYKFVMKHRRALEDMLVHTRDFSLDYFGFKTLQKSYLLKRQDGALNVMETPQHMYMREAVSFNLHDIDSEVALDNIQKTYNYLSQGYYTHASPTMYNAGTQYQQLSSCFLFGIGDSMDDEGGIPDCWKACAKTSKRAGGIGIGTQPIRSRGTLIAGTGGDSSGIVPLARVLNSIARYVNQGGRRPGAIAIYKEPWDGDIFDFLDLRKNTGVEEERARDLFYALWIPDLFMKRVEQAVSSKSKVLWSLMCPHKCPGLYTTYGDEFEKLYTKYEAEGKYNKQVDIMTLWKEILEAQKETGTPYMLYKDHINRKNNQCNLGTIRNSNLCAEILQYSDEKEYAVCNLASVALSAFVRKDSDGVPYFDYNSLHAVCKVAHRNLDRIIDINDYPMPQCKLSNLRHRPVGLGVQGFADALAMLDLPFEDTINEQDRIARINPQAKEVNIRIAETMYHACLEASMELSQEREAGMKILQEEYKAGYFSFDESELCVINITPQANTVLLNKLKPIRAELERNAYLGSYSSFIGSPTSEGKLQYDLWNVTPRSDLNWGLLKEGIQRYGLRNSLVRADMPTASTSQILGNAESTEPYKYCIYTRRVTAGEFVVVNKHLHMELTSLNLWKDDIKAQIIRDRGSIQCIKSIPAKIRDKYRTAFEISKKTIQEMAADRGAYIDQTQSLNYFVPEPNNNILTNIHLGAWKRGLKTGMYYLRREPVEHPIQYTSRGGLAVAVKEAEPEVCISCSA